ncbi:uncharacterized protein [Parasteatoda tepidariorum]|uniref:uncharacterized protein n=1 Tax=Parasteatoda tepidariorum TaxID=114398 RepID=UPI00077F8B95|nr:uncharacterized protein LOC107442569 [Parasteatoda tepidariorum]XP_015911650.1 uncharacterized protein LOC107442569 [Parasteatoda tepidariorum]
MGLISHYLRVFFRSHTRPINSRMAKKGETTSSIVYLVSSTTAFIGLIYLFNKNLDNNRDGPYTDGKAYTPYDTARKFGLDKPATIITFKGFSMEKEVLDRDDEKFIPTKIL